MVALYKLGFPNAFQPYPADRFNPAIDERTDIIPGQETSEAKPTQQRNNNAGMNPMALLPSFACVCVCMCVLTFRVQTNAYQVDSNPNQYLRRWEKQ